jgi:fatty-acyl-CoA synthase
LNRFTLSEVLRKNRIARRVNDARVAATYLDQSLTYDDLDARSNQLASALAGQGFQHGDRVGIVLYNRLEWLEIFFAVAKLGGVVVPINYLLRAPEVEFLLEDSGSTWIFFEGSLTHTLSDLEARTHGRRYVEVEPTGAGHADHDYEGLVAGGEAAEFRPRDYSVTADDLLLLQYTSGTTGAPKGAMHTHSTVMWNSFHQIVDYGLCADDVVMIMPALCWAAGLHDLALGALWVGGRVVISPSKGFSPVGFLERVAEQRVTATLLVPTVLKRVLAEPTLADHDVSSLRLVCSGGEPVPLTAIEDFHRKLPGSELLQCYGMSEFPTMMLYVDAADARKKIGSTGRACSAAEIRVVDPVGTDVTPGETGEIICRSPANMLGYYKREDATASTIVDGWLHTGDLATVDEEGFVFVSGRSKDMIISGGLNVYPAEVERVIAQHPQVAEAAVVGVPDEEWGEIGVAFVVLVDGGELSEQELVEHLRDELATYKMPRRYVFGNDPLPRTTSGKVQKFRIREGVDAS